MHSTMACQRAIEAASAAGAAGLPSRGTPGPRAPLLTALRVRVAMGSETGGCGGAGGGNPLPGEEDAGSPTSSSPSIVTPRRDRPDGPFPAGGAMVVVMEHRVDEPPGRGGGEASKRGRTVTSVLPCDVGDLTPGRGPLRLAGAAAPSAPARPGRPAAVRSAGPGARDSP